ncbi:MAG TPA: NrfD/PsrC family molybdoenzyme membrane anchor subunit [Paenalcaligenes sp.]|nr:NrfD/PsrC family molybdoenzyme membrane anchor subunit [Paenalcaligenes sp.]
MKIIEILTPAYDAAWLPWAVQYFFLVAIATTTAITVSCISFTDSQSPARRILPAAVTVLVVTAIVAPIALFADLQQPGRFWHFYAYFSPQSWMSIGAFLLPVFVLLSLLYGVFWWFNKESLLRFSSILLLISAVSVLIYTGAEVMIIRARPLWHTFFLPINFALTGWLASLGAILFVARWTPNGLSALPAGLMRRLSLTALVLLAISACGWVLAGITGVEPSFMAAMDLFSTYPTWRSSLYGSVVLALVLVVLLSARPERVCHPWHSLLCALVMMGSAWVFRWIILMSVQGVPKYGAGLYLQSMPLNSDGLMGMVGIFGLCIALLAIVTWLLDRFPRAHAFAPLST